MNSVIQLPDLKLLINGAELPKETMHHMIGVRIHQRLNRPSQCVILWVHDCRPDLLPFKMGEDFSLSVRANASCPSEGPLFVGTICGIEQKGLPDGLLQFSIRAYDRLQKLRTKSQQKVHTKVNLTDLAIELTSSCSLSIADAPASPTWSQLFQFGESDFDFLLSVAARCGCYLFCSQNTLNLLTLNGHGTTIPLTYGKDLNAYTFTQSTVRNTDEVNVWGWNTHEGRNHAGKATSPRTPAANGVKGEDLHIFNVKSESVAESNALAQAVLDQRTACGVSVKGVARGNPLIMPGANLSFPHIQDLKQNVVVAEAIHRIDPQQGYVVEFDSTPPEPDWPVEGSLFSLGEVTRVNDPDECGRLRVKLSVFGEHETDWLPVLLPAAGANKGIIALPDVGDQVLVLLEQNNPTQAMVIGSFYAPTTAPESAGVVGNKTKQFHFLTPGGHHIAMDDAGNTLTFTHGNGSFLEFASGKTTLSSRGKLVIEAKGSPVEIKGSRIDMNYG